MKQSQKKRLTITLAVLSIPVIYLVSTKVLAQFSNLQEKELDYTEIINSSGLYTELDLQGFRKKLQRKKQEVLDTASYKDSVSYYEKGKLENDELQKEIDRLDKFIKALIEKSNREFPDPEYLQITKPKQPTQENFQ